MWLASLKNAEIKSLSGTESNPLSKKVDFNKYRTKSKYKKYTIPTNLPRPELKIYSLVVT